VLYTWDFLIFENDLKLISNQVRVILTTLNRFFFSMLFSIKFTGSEGTLGIVTKVSILVAPRLSSINLAFLACGDYLSCEVG
jgi:hypothetical protein